MYSISDKCLSFAVPTSFHIFFFSTTNLFSACSTYSKSVLDVAAVAAVAAVAVVVVVVAAPLTQDV